MTYPTEDEVARNMAFLAGLTPEEIDPEQMALIRELWQRCILDQAVQDSEPVRELLDAGVSEDVALQVIRKVALESLTAALVVLSNAGKLEELAPSLHHGDPSGT